MRTVEVALRDGGRTSVAAEDLRALRDSIEGDVLFPGDAGWPDAVRVWNGLVRRAPALVVRPVGAADVRAAVRFARERGLLLSVKGGGHNIAGNALADGGLTLDMSRMREVVVDAAGRTARVGPGCLLQDVDRATQEHGLATVLGFVSDTGVAGLTLGGGFGYLTRRFGWTVDNLLEVEIVTADGRVLRADRERHADLFWAVRGGGGNLGVVTEFVFRLHAVGPTVLGGVLAWPAETREQTDGALAAYRALTTSAPRELTVFLSLRRAPPLPFVPETWHGRRVALFLVCHTGAPQAADGPLGRLKATLGAPIADVVAPRPYVEQQGLLDGAEPHGMHYYWKTEWLGALDDGLLAAARDLALKNPMPLGEVGILHLGGALNERATDDGAVGNREARYALGILGMWPPDDPDGDGHRAWVRAASVAVRPFSVGNYVNFQTADEGEERIRASYGKNYDRLADVKARYDPENVFRVNRNVAPAASR